MQTKDIATATISIIPDFGNLFEMFERELVGQVNRFERRGGDNSTTQSIVHALHMLYLSSRGDDARAARFGELLDMASSRIAAGNRERDEREEESEPGR